MFISFAVLFLLVLTCLSLGACVGMIVMAMCPVTLIRPGAKNPKDLASTEQRR